MHTSQIETFIFQAYALQGAPNAQYAWPTGLVHCKSKQDAMMRLYQVGSGLTSDVGASVFRLYHGRDGMLRVETLKEVGHVATLQA